MNGQPQLSVPAKGIVIGEKHHAARATPGTRYEPGVDMTDVSWSKGRGRGLGSYLVDCAGFERCSLISH